MTRFAVSGLVNIETTLKVSGFPIEYHPGLYPFFGVRSTVAGVGYNISKALTTLGSEVDFMGLTGSDAPGALVRQTLADERISPDHLLAQLDQTPQSVILYDPAGKRMIFTDLKDVQEQRYPGRHAEALIAACDIAVLCNVNYSRPLLRTAKEFQKPIATDVHAVSSLDDPYNREFMDAAEILFMSDELLPEPPESWIRRVGETFGNEVVVIGLGEKGALRYRRSDESVCHIEAVQSRTVVNTIGAGDALFSTFLHFYAQSRDADSALERAVVFAGYKVGATGAAEGFLHETDLLALISRIDSSRPAQGRDHTL